MVKKIALSAAAFIAAFIIALIIFMPYTQIASKVIDDIVTKRKIDIRYKTLDVGLFGAEITGLATGDITVDKLTVNYNPIGLIFKKLSFNADSPLFIAEGELSGNEVTANVRASVASISKMVGFDGGGSLNADILYNINSGEGSALLKSGSVSFIHPLMKIEADSLNGEVAIKDNMITIPQIKATGKTTLDAKGSITLNNKKIEHSLMDISGTAGIMGMNMNFRLSGNFISPKFTTN